MKFLVSILATALLSYIGGVYFPWWTIAVAGFAVSLILPQRPPVAFLSGFTGVFLLWLLLALLINTANGGILAGRVGALLGIGNSPVLLAVIGGVIGGLVAGMGALSAAYLRRPERGRKAN
ncbi:hypothetical protein [Niabella drilacis]|uniref:Uncharacterized protein n=1 Tax=Niabella drilacis (strain DSM 25811 / CCM 8410 / CCUG 62505 / LMG 26954 / E90) TaxID=1285928 RepID=A0A1G6YDD6_NIADE|nr:hypothetical protein [Niabella drilacis]SDD88370.1 hypothetical protein SAMN04487894_11578 [Niabella drilacis]